MNSKRDTKRIIKALEQISTIVLLANGFMYYMEWISRSEHTILLCLYLLISIPCLVFDIYSSTHDTDKQQ